MPQFIVTLDCSDQFCKTCRCLAPQPSDPSWERHCQLFHWNVKYTDTPTGREHLRAPFCKALFKRNVGMEIET